MSIVLDGTSGVIVSGNTNTLSGVTVGRGAGSVATNTAVGVSALAANTTGANQTAVGSGVLSSTTTGTSNTAVGRTTLNSNTTGSNNVAVGHSALESNSTASNNTAVGYQAGYTNTTGDKSVNLGAYAGFSNSTGVNNVFIGYAAGYSATGSYNTFVGARNAAGSACGELVTSGAKNTILGGYSGNQGGLDIRTASNYIVLSDGDGNPRLWCNGIGNWVIGSSANTINVGTYGVTVQGSTGAMLSLSRTDLDGTARNMQIFNSNTTQVGLITCTTSATAYGTSSDYRLKENVQPMTGALDKVSALKPCTYTWKVDGSASQGFIAHELAEVCPEAVMGEKDAVNEDGSIKPQGIDTSFLVATLTAAIQELNAKVDAQAAEIAALKGTA